MLRVSLRSNSRNTRSSRQRVIIGNTQYSCLHRLHNRISDEMAGLQNLNANHFPLCVQFDRYVGTEFHVRLTLLYAVLEYIVLM